MERYFFFRNPRLCTIERAIYMNYEVPSRAYKRKIPRKKNGWLWHYVSLFLKIKLISLEIRKQKSVLKSWCPSCRLSSTPVSRCAPQVFRRWWLWIASRFPLTHSATRNAGSQIAGFERLRYRFDKLTILINRRQPVRYRRLVIVAATVALALDERWRSKVLEARSRRNERLTAALCSGIRVLNFRNDD